MITQILKVNSEDFDKVIKKAANILTKGDIVAFPTETVYGLGAHGLSSESVKKIFKAKNRPADNPLILHISNYKMLDDIVAENIQPYKEILNHFWPGPLTIILKKNSKVPSIITAKLSTVAVRMPANKVALALIEKCGFCLAAPSANLSGRPSPTYAKMVYSDLNGRIPLIIDGGSCHLGLESTVLDLSSERPRILRPGIITFEELQPFLPDLVRSFSGEIEKNLSPGMKYKHYKPDVNIIVINSLKDILEAKKKFKVSKICIISLEQIKTDEEVLIYDNTEQLSKNLYRDFYELEKKGYDLICIKKFESKGIGKALNNRIKKAADYIF